MSRRLALAALCASLLATLTVPATAFEADASPDGPHPAAVDQWDATDGSRSTARDITALVPSAGGPRVERHQLGAAASAGPVDEDWFRLRVQAAESAADSYLIEAKAMAAGLDPVIEIFAEETTPTVYAALPAAAAGRTATDPLATSAADGAAWMAGGSASLDFLPPSAGTYLIRVRPYYDAGHDGFADGFRAGYGSYDFRIKKKHATRLAGSDRITTAIAVSRERYADGGLKGGSAVVASGYGFPDALSGSTLAGAVGGPLLLTRPTRLPSELKAEIVRLGVSRVYVLGGPTTVSREVARAIDGISGVGVVRVFGADRYETAAAVARKADALKAGGVARVAFVASGLKFPDALSASPMAARNVAPVLLTKPEALSGAAIKALRDPALGITDVVIVGGTPSVSRKVADSLTAILGAGHVRRIAGEDRYRTSAAFATWATANGTGTGKVGTTANPAGLDALSFSYLGLASGALFPDALSGGVACGLAGGPVLLTERLRFSPWIFAGLDPTDGVSRGADYYSKGSTALGRSYVFGGDPSVSTQVGMDLDWLTGRYIPSY